MKEFDEEDFLMLSGIQHFIFCKRQWALIHIEQQWQENLRTVEGEILHENAHDYTFNEKRGNIIISRGMNIFSRTLGLSGTCDVVEFHQDDAGISIYGKDGLFKPIPIEYKRGSPKTDQSDELQLCAQAICLEEMMVCHISEAHLYYGEIKRRVTVILDNNLRTRVYQTVKEMHDYFDKKHTPKVRLTKACKACSLENICFPKLCKNLSVNQYINGFLSEDKK